MTNNQTPPTANNGSLPKTQKPVLVWFRHDLRVRDNPALFKAASSGKPVICLYIWEQDVRPIGGAQRWWLHHSLTALQQDLKELGGKLVLRMGKASELIVQLVEETGADAVLWNRRYHIEGMDIDRALKTKLLARDIECRSFKASLLFEPWEVEKNSGGYFRVFTPFKKACLQRGVDREALPKPRPFQSSEQLPECDNLDKWALLPSAPDWAAEFSKYWKPGSEGARQKLLTFAPPEQSKHRPVDSYADTRNLPGIAGTSALSPHLAFGEISPLEIWDHVHAHRTSDSNKGLETYVSELIWREFSYTLLYFNSNLATENFNERFDDFPWKSADRVHIEKWQRGQTGYPIVDAGMRQLWQTGWMHNRVRMIVASFLIKHLLTHWTEGEKWFWDTLVDADPASNAASWQWVAGSGADAAPYFRIFNPITQGEKFDTDGTYVRRYVPELGDLPDQYLNRPWEAPDDVLLRAGVVLDETYPRPIIDHKFARERALSAYQQTKTAA